MEVGIIGEMEGLLWDSREFDGIVERLYIGSLKRDYGNSLSTLWSDPMMIVIDWSFEATSCKWYIGHSVRHHVNDI